MNICVIGTGYVGLVTGTCFSEFGVHVTCVDNDAQKIADLKNGKIPIYEPGLEDMVARNVAEGRLEFTTDLAQAVQDNLVIFIAVGTPPLPDGRADLSMVEGVAREIAANMNGYKVIVTKSTVPVGTGERVRQIMLETQTENVDFDICSNPEFLREGSALEDCMKPDRVVIGCTSDQAAAILKDLYRPLYLLETPFVITDLHTAELIKYAANSFLATKISFINEVANLAEKVGGDVQTVARAMGLDGRIGKKFLHAGPGFGGSCFPKDVSALYSIAADGGYDFKLLKAVLDVNAQQRLNMVDKIKNAVGGDLNGKTVCVLGLAFKPNTDDMREAPSIEIIQQMQRQGATIRACDPVAEQESRKIFQDISYHETAYDAAEGADIVVIITEWNRFRNLDLNRLKGIMNAPVLCDLRNIYDPKRVEQAGFKYHCVGNASYR